MRLLVPLLFASAISLAAQSPGSPGPDSRTWENSSATSAALEPIQIAPQEALAHRTGRDKPVYPRFALAAGLTGTVKCTVIIGPDGLIQQQGTLTGPPSFLASAQAWINASRFRPFLRDGQPVSVTTTLPVVFHLPPGAHSAHPLAALYQRNITSTIEREGPESPPRVRWSMLSPAMRDWLARYQAAVATGNAPHAGASSPAIAGIISGETDAPPLTQMPGHVALYPVPLNLTRHHLYLLFEFSHGCAKSDCPIYLLEDSPAGVGMLIDQLGASVDLHRRHDSPYPDLLFWSDTQQAGISNINGFSYYAGEWGQLYCGTDDAAQDSELDDEAVEHRGTHVPRPPLVTLCK